MLAPVDMHGLGPQCRIYVQRGSGNHNFPYLELLSRCPSHNDANNFDVPPLGSTRLYNIGALIIRIGFWGPLYYNYKKEPQTSIGNYVGPDGGVRSQESL